MDDPIVKTWRDRWAEGESVKETWEKEYRVPECYQYWKGNQLKEPFDSRNRRKLQVNLVHPSVRTQIPSLYFYRPFGRVIAAPERADTPGETVDEKAQLLQDTGAHFVRDRDTQFRPATFAALKESFWAIGAVEVGYSPDFADTPSADRPPLKEEDDTKNAIAADEFDFAQPLPSENPDELGKQLKELKDRLRSEKFYVKRIPARQVMVSSSDCSIVENNDWVGYWEDFYVEDVKRSSAYKNKRNLEAATPSATNEDAKKSGKVRLYKVWDLRTNTKLVFAEGHDKLLMKKSFKRCALFFLRPDIDPNHFWPIPPIYHWLGVQDEYTESRQFMSANRRARVARFTYDEDAVTPSEVAKFESNDFNIAIGRKGGTMNVFEPIMQPNMSDSAAQTLMLSKQEFDQVSGVPAEARQATSQKTATQARIQNTSKQVQDSFDRSTAADWLGELIFEIIQLAIDHMNLSRWIAVNVDPDSPMALNSAMEVASRYKEIKAGVLEDAAQGIRWQVQVDVESLSPATEDEQAAKFNQAMAVLANPAQARLLSRSPELTKRMLDINGLKAGRDQGLIFKALQESVAMEMELARAQVGPGPGVTSLPGSPNPNPVPPVTASGLPGVR